ncbi:MAG: hypothetical protein ACE5OR_14475 [bacterium]
MRRIGHRQKISVTPKRKYSKEQALFRKRKARLKAERRKWSQRQK